MKKRINIIVILLLLVMATVFVLVACNRNQSVHIDPSGKTEDSHVDTEVLDEKDAFGVLSSLVKFAGKSLDVALPNNYLVLNLVTDD